MIWLARPRITSVVPVPQHAIQPGLNLRSMMVERTMRTLPLRLHVSAQQKAPNETPILAQQQRVTSWSPSLAWTDRYANVLISYATQERVCATTPIFAWFVECDPAIFTVLHGVVWKKNSDIVCAPTERRLSVGMVFGAVTTTCPGWVEIRSVQ